LEKDLVLCSTLAKPIRVWPLGTSRPPTLDPKRFGFVIWLKLALSHLKK
jgi:hypothetical protein